jgi:hypothetical protein
LQRPSFIERKEICHSETHNSSWPAENGHYLAAGEVFSTSRRVSRQTGWIEKAPELDLPGDYKDLERSLRSINLKGAWKDELHELAGRLPFERLPSILISEEHFSAWRDAIAPQSTDYPAQKPFRGEGPGKLSHPMVSFLYELRMALPTEVELLSILTLRAQYTFLPSLAAQLGEHRIGPTVRRIIRRKDEFILWDQLVRDLEDLRGPEKHQTLLFEDGVKSNAQDMVLFCGLKPKLGHFDYEAITPYNQRRVTNNSSWVPGTKPPGYGLGIKLSTISKKIFRTELPRLSRAYTRLRRWLLGREPGRGLNLTKRQMSHLKKYVDSSNASLSSRLQRDLRPLGY